jgi:endonuclease III
MAQSSENKVYLSFVFPAGPRLIAIHISHPGRMEPQRVADCIALLEEEYGIPRPDGDDPVDLLVKTILSQNTSDTNSLRAFDQLKNAFPGYEDLLAAPDDEVAGSIRGGGLAQIKSRRIKEALCKIKEDRGEISLDFLAGMKGEEAMNYLLRLPGVGPKTASVVLLFAFEMPFLPVDTHVFRLSRRLGLIEENVSPERAQKILEGIVPEEKYISMHLNLIRHGRLVCRARGPKHDECALKGCCAYIQGQKT